MGAVVRNDGRFWNVARRLTARIYPAAAPSRDGPAPPALPGTGPGGQAQLPASFMPVTKTEPTVFVPIVYSSAPMPTMLCSMSFRLPAMVTSCTG